MIELLGITNEHEHKEFKTELENLCKVQIELIRSRVELESLQQTKIQIPPK